MENDNFHSLDSSELRGRAEERLKKKDVNPDFYRSKEEFQRIVQELSIHQIELEMQNEALQDSRDKIEREHNRYMNLYDFAPVGYLTLARDGKIREANLAAARMLSVERCHLKKGGGFGRFIARRDIPAFNSMVERVFQSRTQEQCEIMIESTGITEKPIKLQQTFRIDAIISDNSQECLLSLTDISDTRHALDELLLANKELVFQNEEKEKRAAELVLAITAQKDGEQKILSYVKQLESAMQGTLQAVAKVVEVHDPYTAGHELRVGQISADIAREMGWSEEKCNTLRLIGLVHDIGKMSIPSEILSKPSQLSAIEFELIKTHAEQGYQILKNVEFPLPIAEIIREHHERMDGSGYPQGLKGENTLPESRILAVADVLEAMASDRPYRASLGIEAAISEIETHRGSLFDPDVTDAMLRLIREKGYHLPE